MKKHQRFLFLPETYPSGLTGTSVKTRYTIEHLLKQGHLVDVVCPHFETLIKKELRHKNLKIFYVTKPKMRRLRLGLIWRLLSLIFSPKPIEINRIFDGRIQAILDALENSFKYDSVFFDGFSTLQYATRYQENYIYIDDEDITDLVKRRAAETKNYAKKIFLFSEYYRCKHYEKEYLKNVSQIWAISPNSLRRLKTLSAARTLLMPTFIAPQKNVFRPAAKNIVFTGTLSWSENYVGLRWFISHCWESVLNAFPDTKLYIVGQQEDDTWKKLAKQYKNITLKGYVPDLATVYKDVAVAISPIFINSGIKIKVLTYLAYALPTVAIKESTWGMFSTSGIELADKDNFAQKVISLLSNRQKRRALSKAGHKNVQTHHSAVALQKFFIKAKVLGR